MFRPAFAATALMLIATAPLADEAWESSMGEIIYQDEIGDAAIFSFYTPDGVPAELVIPGLAGNFYNRGFHEAYWVGEGAPQCDASLGAPDGVVSQHWGQATLAFDRASWPTPFTLTLGYCFGPMAFSMRAELP